MYIILSSIRNIPKWRWIILSILLLGSSFEAYSYITSYGVQPSLYELVLTQIDKPSTLTLYFIFLLLIMDIGFERKKEQPLTNKKIFFSSNFICFNIICFIFLSILICTNILTLLLFEGNINLNNELYTLSGITLVPSIAMLLSLLFLFFRFCFILVLIFIINIRCKKFPFGYIGGLLISLIDSIAYYNLMIKNFLGILPFEHSYLEAAISYSSNPIMNIAINILYWIVLLIILGVFVLLIDKFNKRKLGVFSESSNK